MLSAETNWTYTMFDAPRPSEWTLYVRVESLGVLEHDVRVHWTDLDGRRREREVGTIAAGEFKVIGMRQADANIPDNGRMSVTALRGKRRSRRLYVAYRREVY